MKKGSDGILVDIICYLVLYFMNRIMNRGNVNNLDGLIRIYNRLVRNSLEGIIELFIVTSKPNDMVFANEGMR